MAKPVRIKVCLTNQGADTETPWADDLGPAPGPPGSRRARLINVPFMHAKPTWGDTIIVSPVEHGFPTWDRGGVPWDQIGSRIAHDGGRWAMIVDYTPHPDAKDAFGALAYACAEHDVVCEGAVAPRDGKPGSAYLAVPDELDDAELMQRLRRAGLPCELVQIHPAPASVPRAARATPATKVKTAPATTPASKAKSAPATTPKPSAKSAPAKTPKPRAKSARTTTPKPRAKSAPKTPKSSTKAKRAVTKTKGGDKRIARKH